MFAASKTDGAVATTANYIEDVFSTYLYTGNGKAQSINNGISIGSAVGGGAYFNGTSDYLSLTPLSLSGDFTIEGWVWFRTTASNPITVGDFTSVNKQALRYLNGFNYYNNSGGGAVQGTIALSANQWVHLAVSRVGSTTRIFTNGVLDGSVTDSGAFSVRNIGCIANGVNMLDGYISNLRVLNGTGLYTSTFTVPTAPLTAITNTVLLICQSPSPFTDNAPTPNTLTQNGSPAALTYGGPLSSTPAGSGGMVWIKSRSAATDHALYDTVRGATFDLVSNSAAAQTTQTDGLVSFNSNGFNVGQLAKLNTNAATYASWTFREQAKFFDVVTYTGTGANRTVSHNLGSVPGCIMVKRTDTTAAWSVYHRSLANTEYLVLNTTAAKATGATYWNSTTPTSTEFSLGTSTDVNASGGTYVAYLFAHDAGGFGATGTDNVISCGSFNGASAGSVNLGYEPQWILFKDATSTTSWVIYDVMRGWSVTSGNYLLPNTSGAEANTTSLYPVPNATGFSYPSGMTSGNTIYIAIRRGPMKTPTSGTSVFAMDTQSSFATNELVDSNFPPDQFFAKDRVSTGTWYSQSRLTGGYLSTNSTAAETSPGFWLFDGAGGKLYANTSYTNTPIYYLLGRAPGFFDVVCDTGTASAHTITHGLTVVPELMIRKKRNSTTNSDWVVWHTAFTGTNKYLYLNSTAAEDTNSAFWTSTAPTSTVFSVGTGSRVNNTGDTYVTYLFASVNGVSKVGSYTGNGSSQTINCGFAAGARFILIKRTSSTGDWYVWDTARGIVSGNDPRLSLNTTAAEVTTDDSIDPDNSGFIVNQLSATNINVNAATYIYLAIA